MDIHKPKPWRGWRELLKEIGTIVIGVLIALAAEQTVEWLHWRQEVQETRETLRSEVARDLAVVEQRKRLSSCYQQKLDELRTWVRQRAEGASASKPRPFALPASNNFHTSVWRVAVAGTLTHMPVSERVSYSKFYDYIDLAALQRNDEASLWRRVSQISRQQKPGVESVAELEGDLDALDHLNNVRSYNASPIGQTARELGVTEADATGSLKDAPDGGLGITESEKAFCAKQAP